MAASPSLLASPSDFDTTFNGGMFDVVAGTGGNDGGLTVVVQHDGRILAGGQTAITGGGQDWLLLRRNADGTLDTTFGAGSGKVIPGMGGGAGGHTNGAVTALVLQSDQKIVGAGYALDATGAHKVVTVARFNADGSFDSGFGTGGKTFVDLGSSGAEAYAVGVQRDGMIVVVATQMGASSSGQLAVMRFTTAGVLDASFATGGIFQLPASVPVASRGWALALALQPDGKILAGTEISTNPVVVRLTTAGALDGTFGSAGIATVPLTSGTGSPQPAQSVKALQALPDGKILGLANNGSNWLFEMRRDGSMFTPFGPSPSHGWSQVTDTPNGMAWLPPGPIRTDGSQSCACFTLNGYTPDGAVDVAFPSLSRLGPSGQGNVQLTNLALQPDGRLVGIGYDHLQVLFARFLGDPQRLRPKDVIFGPAFGVPTSTLETSNTVRIVSLTVGAWVPVTVSGGTYSINGGAFTARLGYVTNGDRIAVQHTSAATSGTTVTTTLKFGGLNTPNAPWVINGAQVIAKFDSVTL